MKVKLFMENSGNFSLSIILFHTNLIFSSKLPVRNRLPGGWGGGGDESLARPSFPISIMYKHESVRIRVNLWQVACIKYRICSRQKEFFAVSYTVVNYRLQCF